MKNRFRWREGWTVRRGMLLCGLIVFAALAVSHFLPGTVTLCVSLLLALGLLLLLVVPRLRYAVLVFSFAVALLSLGRGLLYNAIVIPPVELLDGTTDTMTGRVVDCPTSGRMYTVQISASQYLRTGTKILLYCSDRVAPRVNETVSTVVEYRIPYDSQRHHRADGVYLSAFPTSYDETAIKVMPPGAYTDWTGWLDPVRERFEYELTDLLVHDEGALLTAMCLGDKSALSDSVSDSFRACGLPHLIAVSGLHMAVIAGSLQKSLERLRVNRRVVGVATLIVLFLYMWMVGFAPSVLRSGLMYGIVLAGMLFRRQGDSLNSLGLALTVVLLLSPGALYDLGFWLSFCSTAGIICLFPRLQSWLRRFFAFLPTVVQRPVGWVTDSFAITLAATLPLLPIMALSFRELSLIAPLANLLTVTPCSWMLVLGLAGVLLRFTVVFYWVGDLLLLLAGLIAKYTIAVAEWLGAAPGATLLLQPTWLLVWVAGAALVLIPAMCGTRARIVRRLWCVLLAVFLAAHSVSALFGGNVTTVQVLTDGESAAVVLERDGRTAVLAQDLSTLDSARRVFEADGYRYPTLLLLDSGAPVDAAYMAEWISDYPDAHIAVIDRSSAMPSYATVLQAEDEIAFWQDHTVCVLDGGWWLLTAGETTLLISPPEGGSPPKTDADGYVLFADAAAQAPSLDTTVAFCVCEDDTAIAGDGVIAVAPETVGRVLTDGSGGWYTPLL